MARKIVTLYIDDTSIRLLVTHGKQIKKWAELPVEPGLIEGAVITKEAEVATRIKQLLKDQKVRAKKVIVGLSGLPFLTRPITIPRLPKAMLDEAVIREAKRVLPIPLEQVYISWQTIPSPGEKIQVFLAAVRRRSADALLKTVRQAGLDPYLMDLKPVALARVVKEATAAIVDVQPTEFDIVIMADGVPQPIRTVPLPSETQSWQGKFQMIKDELDRTIKFYNSNNVEKPLDSSVPIYVSGELAHEPELCQSLSDGLGHPILLVSSPLKCPEQFDPSGYMVNIGLALKELLPQRGTGPLVVNLNVLPAAYQPKPLSLARVLALPSALTTIGLLVPLVMLTQSASANIASMHSQLDTTNQLFTQRQLQRQEMRNNIAELEKKLAEAGVSRDTFTTALGSLDRQGKEINSNLQVATNTLPSTVSLASISYASSILTISGKSPSETEILSYARRLDASGRFSEIVIASIKKTEGESMDFTLVLKARG